MKAAGSHAPAQSAALKSGVDVPVWSACDLPLPSGRVAGEMADQTGQPTKEQIREWLKSRQAKSGPPPNIEQIRRELGWKTA